MSRKQAKASGAVGRVEPAQELRPTVNESLHALRVPLAALKLDPANARKHSRRNLDAIKSSLKLFGQQKPIVTLPDGTVIAGNGTVLAARELGWEYLAAAQYDGPPESAKAYALADNRSAELAEWDRDVLAETLAEVNATFELEALGWSAEEHDALLGVPFGAPEGSAETDSAAAARAEQATRSLAERFLVPPFTVLDARQGYWQERKRAWLALGLRSELGRGESPASSAFVPGEGGMCTPAAAEKRRARAQV